VQAELKSQRAADDHLLKGSELKLEGTFHYVVVKAGRVLIDAVHSAGHGNDMHFIIFQIYAFLKHFAEGGDPFHRAYLVKPFADRLERLAFGRGYQKVRGVGVVERADYLVKTIVY